ncbi:MAG: hypothetical protein TE42_09605 [Candidatus Synechococcus spongiarum SP3]|uniref:Uncharacterized protein n=1 Tax=Candidatus Synechococcus spongiarum SP3 TaxID=1604020 RepID=A0A0G2HJ98_9SYNE|nr:MAG: hypothetical protein TE42_09605 [Candidatus Synechococcus spongiarum SP3]
MSSVLAALPAGQVRWQRSRPQAGQQRSRSCPWRIPGGSLELAPGEPVGNQAVNVVHQLGQAKRRLAPKTQGAVWGHGKQS